jgi:hypothetical protein
MFASKSIRAALSLLALALAFTSAALQAQVVSVGAGQTQTNTGTITTGPPGQGIFQIAGGGTLNNNGTIFDNALGTNAGTINNNANATFFNNSGNLTNFGSISNAGSLFNQADLQNIGTITNSGQFSGSGSITNSGTFSNSGLANLGFMTNNATLTSSGTLGIFGTLQNNGTITSTGLLTNSSLLINNFGATMNIGQNSLFNPNIGSLQLIDNVGTVNMLGGNFLNANQGSSFYGQGVVNGNVVLGGLISPGNCQCLFTNTPTSEPGTLTINGDYTQTSTGLYNAQLGDRINISGNASLAGTLSFSIFPGFTVHAADSFIVMTFDSSTGAFDTLNLPALDPSLFWEVEYNQNDVTLFADTPEPTSLILLASGFGGLFFRRHKR